MKKLITLMLLVITIIFSGQILMVQASEPEETVSSESVGIIDKGLVAFSNVTFNMSNYMSTGYQTLVMGSSTTYTINLTNVLQYFNNYTASNVSNIYLQFDLAAVNTGYQKSEYQWMSSNTSFDTATQKLSLGTTMPSEVIAKIWWNVIGQSGGAPSSSTGGLRINSITITVEYTAPVEIYTQISDWSDLPKGINNFNSYNTWESIPQNEIVSVAAVTDNLNGTHNIYLDLESKGKFVAQNVTIPSDVRDNSSVLVLYFATKDYQFLWFFETLSISNPYLDSDYLLWNLTLNEYQRVVSGTIYGMPYAEGNGVSTYNMLYTDLVIPWQMDEIISIRMQYEYRYHYLTANYGQWVDTQKTLFRDAYTNTYYPWWIRFSGLLGFSTSEVSHNFQWMSYNQIQDITQTYDLSKKQTMVSYLNANTDNAVEYTNLNVFPGDYTVAKVFLGQYDKFGSNGIEAKDIVVMSIRYTYSGIEYSTIHPDQVIPDMPPEYPGDIVGNPWDGLADALSKIWGPAYWIIAFAASFFVAKVFMYKSKDGGFKYVIKYGIFMAIILLIIYYSYQPPKIG